MEKKKRPKDISQLAHQIVQEATQERQEPLQTLAKEKNPAAVALGRLGGLKGGPARAKSLSPKKRREIAQKAAKVRWIKD
ncbi:MAG TPA: hypothetical protein VK568_09685 [Thermodesulfobacteriota bacterium]|jgi:methenyltetrahydromethanopterin cyclohydrolase|nr:hypothetical protein [Thermodesulfobacteriota bacterium]